MGRGGELAGDLLHRDQADPLLMAGVERLVERRVLVEPGSVHEHDRVDDPALGRRLDDLGAILVVGREAEELRLARLPDRLGRLLELLALDEVHGLVERVVVAEPVDEVEVDVVGPQGGQPLVDRLQHLLGRGDLVLGDQDDLLANLGGLLEPLLEAGLGAVEIGGVERADAAGEGQPEQAVEHASLAEGPGAHLEQGHLDAGLAELPLGENRRLGRGVLRLHAGGCAQGRRRGEGTGLEERAAVGVVRLFLGHRSRLLLRMDFGTNRSPFPSR